MGEAIEAKFQRWTAHVPGESLLCISSKAWWAGFSNCTQGLEGSGSWLECRDRNAYTTWQGWGGALHLRRKWLQSTLRVWAVLLWDPSLKRRTQNGKHFLAKRRRVSQQPGTENEQCCLTRVAGEWAGGGRGASRSSRNGLPEILAGP